ncbi:MAG: MSMEG_1061 family FMN-dependent PPOX-type flavoprotein [Paracoccaceae bacterium]
MRIDTPIEDVATLEALYGTANPTSLAKVAPRLTPAYRDWIAAARFMALATVGPEGLDVSPRGDGPGDLLAIEDEATLLIPARRGNNRLDSLRNIVRDPRVALLFLIPGVGETLRVQGRARLAADETLRARFAARGRLPATVIVVGIEAVYFQCARALARSALWQPEGRPEAGVPSAGAMARSAMPGFDAEAYDAELAARQAATLY